MNSSKQKDRESSRLPSQGDLGWKMPFISFDAAMLWAETTPPSNPRNDAPRTEPNEDRCRFDDLRCALLAALRGDPRRRPVTDPVGSESERNEREANRGEHREEWYKGKRHRTWETRTDRTWGNGFESVVRLAHRWRAMDAIPTASADGAEEFFWEEETGPSWHPQLV